MKYYPPPIECDTLIVTFWDFICAENQFGVVSESKGLFKFAFCSYGVADTIILKLPVSDSLSDFQISECIHNFP